MKLLTIFLTIISLSYACALTTSERNLVLKAKEQLKTAVAQYEQALAFAGEADRRAQEAEIHASETTLLANDLQSKIDAHQKNEELLSRENAKLLPFYEQGHKYWGIGAIMLGLGILFRHTLVVVGVLIVIFVLLSIFVPAFGPVLGIVTGFFKRLFRRKAS